MSNFLYKIANEYINFEIKGKKVNIPYCIVKFEGDKTLKLMARTSKYKNYAGKGTIEQIRKALLDSANKEKFSLEKATSEEITRFMITQGIGVDCSGFVYNVLDAYLKKEKNISLASILLRYPGITGKIERFILRPNRVRRISAATLTNNLNTVKIEKVSDIKLGDMIRLTDPDYSRGKHISLIIDVDKEYITYANSSERTKIQGPHFAKIKITNPDRVLEEQQWLEVTQKDVNYQKDAFDPKRGDSVRRLRYLA